MSDYRHVKPADELGRIMDPEDGEFLPPKGKVVKWSPYWERLRLRGGEISDRAAADPTEAEPDEPIEDAAEVKPAGKKRPRRRTSYAPKPAEPKSAEPSDAPAEGESSGEPEQA